MITSRRRRVPRRAFVCARPVRKMMEGVGTAAFFLFLLCATHSPLNAANAGEDPLLRAMKEEMERSKAKLKMDNVAAPYYIEYRVTELDDFEANAAFGALRNEQRGGGRFLRVVVRIGDYKQDSYFGAGEGTVDLVHPRQRRVCRSGIARLATDRAYKAAGEALSAKQSMLKMLTIDQPVDDFSQAAPVELIEPVAHLPSTDFTPWVHLLEQSSGLNIAPTHAWRDFEILAPVSWPKTVIFVNSEGTVARSGHARTTSISIAGSTQAADGSACNDPIR